MWVDIFKAIAVLDAWRHGLTVSLFGRNVFIRRINGRVVLMINATQNDFPVEIMLDPLGNISLGDFLNECAQMSPKDYVTLLWKIKEARLKRNNENRILA